MKSTGIVRKVDELGRVVLPIELRRSLELDIKDALDIDVNGNEIILRKYVPCCVFCKSGEDVKEVMGKSICAYCLRDIKEIK